MSWTIGLALVFGSFIVIAIVAIAIDEMNGPDDIDRVAEQKRQNLRNARRQSGEFQEPRL